MDVRIVCATNRNPLEEVRAGRFREDLYYRLHVISIQMPPLRERGSDMRLIAESLLLEYSEEENKSFNRFSPEAAAMLAAYEWPGNVREMQNVIRQIVVLNNGEEVDGAMLQAVLTGTMSPGVSAPVVDSVPETDMVSQTVLNADSTEILPLWKMEELHIQRALADCNDSIPKAAALLEVSPSTLYRKLGKKDPP